jgi:hypothetical protein
MSKNSRADKYRKTIRATAKQLGVPPSSELARHVSLLKMMREQIEIRLIDGRGDPDPDSLLKLDATLRQYLPFAEPAGVQLVIKAARLCHRCKAELEAEPAPPPPPVPPSVAAEGSANVITPPKPDAPKPRPSLERADNVVELVPDKLKAHRGREF